MPSSTILGKQANNVLPDTGETVPAVAWPTVLLWTATFLIWILTVNAWLNGDLSTLPMMVINAAVYFVMFTVLHDASHHAVGQSDWINEVFGRLSMPFVSIAAPFSVLRFIHIEHHRNTNEHDDGRDPDAWCSDGPLLLQPLRWPWMDLRYIVFWAKHAKQRPIAELVETAVHLSIFVGLILWSWQAGWFWEFAALYLIPNRVAVFLLIWWFDWLPHNGLEHTSRSNRFQATRNRVGMEWFFTPLMLSQNYHLVHHLHPSIPFYAYRRAWLKNEDAYLRQGSAISNVWGKTLSNGDYRAWRGLPEPADEPSQGNDASGRAQFHKLRVQSMRQLTDDSMAVTFKVPESLKNTFSFTQGQHITLRSDIGGERDVRRNYSVCSSAIDGELMIGVKHIPGGTFSSYVMNELRIGDKLDVMAPSGRFFTQLSANHAKTYVLIAAGSGITPMMSIIQTTLSAEPESRCILLYGNKNTDSIMFCDELERLRHEHPERLQLLHFLSQEEQQELGGSLTREDSLGWPRTAFDQTLLAGRINGDKVAKLLGSYASANRVDEWFMCGPQSMIEDVRDTLENHGVSAEHIHYELFIAAAKEKPAHLAASNFVPSAVTVTCGGQQTELRMDQPEQTILDAALEQRNDIPYSCMGGACGSCRAKLVSGSVDMDQNFALDQSELDAGYVLTCQCHPTSEMVVLDYDA